MRYLFHLAPVLFVLATGIVTEWRAQSNTTDASGRPIHSGRWWASVDRLASERRGGQTDDGEWRVVDPVSAEGIGHRGRRRDAGNCLVILRPESGTTGVVARELAASSKRMTIIPNPPGSRGTLSLTSKGGHARSTLHNNPGQMVGTIFEGAMAPGSQNVPIDLS